MEIRERVRGLYERFPYPTPTQDLNPFRQGKVAELGFLQPFYHKFWPRETFRDDLDILVAGCGSSQAARWAAAHPNSNVTGIDLSEASLKQTRALADQFHLQNLALERLSLEDSGQLNKTFDLIVSTGVLHHLPDPAAGLRALRELLRVGGVIYWMVYAPLGRDAIYYLQNFLATLGVRADRLDAADIHALQELVSHLPPSHPLWQRRQQFPDLMNQAELMDYLLHPQDRPFTITEYHELSRQCGLKVQDLFNRAHYQIPAGRMNQKLLRRWNALDEVQRLAAGEQYRAALFRHDLISCRADRPEASFRLGGDWREWIPVRAPGLQVLDGQAFWPGHAFDDIRLSLAVPMRRFLREVNDKSSVAEIQRVSGVRVNKSLLQPLVDHDYLWFRQ
ncbi:MAG: methyltransferase [Gammaproteobacteria bacterium]|nr:methyltransferase [Gammaproteobacteria bacterium]